MSTHYIAAHQYKPLDEFKRVRRRQPQRIQPGQFQFSGENLSRHVVLEVVATQDGLDLIERATSRSPGVLTQVRQATLLQLDRVGNADDLELACRLACRDTIAGQPQLFGQLGSIAPIGLASVGVCGLNQHDSLFTKVLQHLKQPVDEAAAFYNRPKSTAMYGSATSQLLKELKHFIQANTYLASQGNVASWISPRQM